MRGIVNITAVERCMGCGLCILWASGKVNENSSFSLAHSPILVEHLADSSSNAIFSLQIDEGSRAILGGLEGVCPRSCFAIEEEN